MVIDKVREMMLIGMPIMRGRIVKVSADGEILIESDAEGLTLCCDFLRTSAAPLPKLNPGDSVLYAFDEMGLRGYVLGVIQKYLPENADEKIELRCGKSSLTMNKDGRVVIKGTQLVSRASEINKIKGAAVKIN